MLIKNEQLLRLENISVNFGGVHALKNVSLITTTSDSQKKDLQKIHKKKNIELIFNGFFPEIIDKSINIQDSECFKIAYGGTIYPFQKLEVFLEGFKRFVNEINNPNVIMQFVGVDFFNDQTNRILGYDVNINKYIEILPRMRHDLALEKLSEANVLLLLGDSKIRQLYAKVFDYIAIGRKILFVVNDYSNVRDILIDTNTGMICENEDDAYMYLKKCYEEFILNKTVKCYVKNISKYTREIQAEKMILLMNEIVK